MALWHDFIRADLTSQQNGELMIGKDRLYPGDYIRAEAWLFPAIAR